jgi:glycosyltransferase involved in cell wall biosynthesis
MCNGLVAAPDHPSGVFWTRTTRQISNLVPPTNVYNGDVCELSVVIPIFNERDNLDSLDEELRMALLDVPLKSEIIYIDDASTDGSSERLDELVRRAAGGISTRALHFRRNFGQTSAMAAGFDHARGSIVIPIDGDLQNDPHDIVRLLAKLDEGFDVVSGWRRHRKDKAISRRLPSTVANWLIGSFTGLRLHSQGLSRGGPERPAHVR